MEEYIEVCSQRFVILGFVIQGFQTPDITNPSKTNPDIESLLVFYRVFSSFLSGFANLRFGKLGFVLSGFVILETL